MIHLGMMEVRVPILKRLSPIVAADQVLVRLQHGGRYQQEQLWFRANAE